MSANELHRRDWLKGAAGGVAALSALSYRRVLGANERVTAAVIGRTGHGDYGHSLDEVWLAVPEAQLVAVADDSPEGLSQAAARLKLDQAFADYREMLDKVKPQVVSIAFRWIDKHHEVGMACAERGIHMYMEKPFVSTLAQADELAAACQRTNTKLALACQAHYSPKVAMAKRLIADGKIGQVLEYRARGKEDHRGGAEDFWVLGTHMLDLILYFGGAPTWCFATLTQNGKPVQKADIVEGNEGIGPIAGDSVQVSYGMSDGATAYFASRRDMGRKANRFGLQIFGTGGIIEIMANYMAPVKILRDPHWSPGRTKKPWQDISSAGIDQPEPIKVEGNLEGNRIAVLDLLAAIRENREPLCGITSARATVEMIHAAFESHRLQTRAALPLANRQHPLEML